MIFIRCAVDDASFVEAMKRLMKEKGYFVYPGILQGFDPEKCFCFRINMLLNSNDIENGLKAVLEYIKNTEK